MYASVDKWMRTASLLSRIFPIYAFFNRKLQLRCFIVRFPDMKIEVSFFGVSFGRIWILLVAVLSGVGVWDCSGSDHPLVDVRRVGFSLLEGEEWLRMRIEFSFRSPPEGGLVRSGGLDDVGLQVIQCYGSDTAGFRFFRAGMELVEIETERKHSVSFFLPQAVIRKAGIRDVPYAWLLEWFVDGVPIPPGNRSMSDNLVGKPEVLASFRRRASEEAPVNDGILIPSWALPSWVECDRADEPAFRRRDTCVDPGAFRNAGGKVNGE